MGARKISAAQVRIPEISGFEHATPINRLRTSALKSATASLAFEPTRVAAECCMPSNESSSHYRFPINQHNE
ncbi:hypothetical protein [Bradyrhizobium neotropicale]|uniref:hypothetical protein n=1 Tax=Bradyrhizobium neotropicale TaxID=1497615 RepID=UPI001FEE4F7D|nr:hypothetical protein [Bradyrhizobium neotropicale]